MHTLTPIEDLIEHEDWTRLLRRSLRSASGGGRSTSTDAIGRRLARRMLAVPDVVGPAALGFALQSLCDRPGRSCRQGDAVARRLVTMQGADGLFQTPCGDDESETVHEPMDGGVEAPVRPACLAATAVAVAGLRAWQRRGGRFARHVAADPLAGAADVHRHNAFALAQICWPDTLNENHVSDELAPAITRALHALAVHQHPNGLIGNCPNATTITLWQLADHPGFRKAVRFFDLLRAVKRYATRIDRPTAERDAWTSAA